MTDSWIISSLFVVIPSILLALIILWLVRKVVPIKTLKTHHDVAGFTFSIVGVLYSVILGFTVINVQERFNKTEEAMHTEATLLTELARDATVFPSQNREQIVHYLREYVTYVTQEEWGNQNIHLQAQTILKKIWNSYYAIDLNTDMIKVWYQLSIGKLDRLMEARLAREYSSWQHLSSMMWCLLLIGAVITSCFMFFFGLENIRMQMLMTSLLVGYLSFMLFLVFSLDHMFKGSSRIQPTAFEQVLPLISSFSPLKVTNS